MPSVLLALALLAAHAAAAPADSTAGSTRGGLEPAGTIGERADGGARLEPAGVATDAFGRVYVSDAAGHRLVRFDADGRRLDEAGSLGSEANQFRRPGAVARLGSLGVAVLDTENRRVVTWDLQMERLGVLADFGGSDFESSLGPVTPVSLAADRGGALYVADADGDRVLAFDFAGRFLRALGGHGRDDGRFAGLGAVAAAPRGALVACDRPSSAPGAGVRLQWFDAGGRPLGGARTVLAGTGTRGRPGRLALAVDDSSRVAVADEGAGCVEVFGADRAPLARLAGLARPCALAFAPDGTLLVAEAAAARVRRFRLVPAAPGE